ncbi:MAG: hypothetical protein Q9163_005836 [Psora crenata]
MVITSPYPHIDIPETNILTYLFGDGTNVPDTPLWVDALDDTKSLSCRTALQWVKRLSLGLDKLGVKPGEVVMTVTPNHIFVPVAYLGIIAGGRIFSGANPIYTADEICHQLKDTGARTLLVHPSLLQTARKAADEAGLPSSALFIFSDTPQDPVVDIRDWSFILAPSSVASGYRWPHFDGQKSKQQIATINYSSGTTGLPKGVIVTHHNVISNVEQSICGSYAEGSRFRSLSERWICFLPLYHAYGQMYAIMMAAKLQIPVYVMQTFELEIMLSVVQKRKITSLHVAPPILVLLSKHPAVSKYDLSSIVQVLCGAAPLSQSLQNEVSKRLSTPIAQGYGMTELTCSALGVPPDRFDNRGGVGVLLANNEAKMLDDGHRAVKRGERGELYIKGPSVSSGYWKNEQATREAMLEDGWLKTGDVAVADENGWFWIVDRRKELIKVSGYQVAPAELEAVLLTHPWISDAAVCGMSSSFSEQELVRAYVVLGVDAKGKMKEDDIVEWMKGKVAKYKWLTGGVCFVDEIPKSAAGKILRKVLREWAKRDVVEQGGGAKAKAKVKAML